VQSTLNVLTRLGWTAVEYDSGNAPHDQGDELSSSFTSSRLLLWFATVSLRVGFVYV
jgi:hypothetical protein